MQTAFGYIRIGHAGDNEIHNLRDMISEYAAAEGMRLVTIYVDQETPSTDIGRPGLTILLEAVGRSDRAVVLVPDMTHLSHALDVRRIIGEKVTAFGGAIMPVPPPPQQHQERSSEISRNRPSSPSVRVAVERFPALLSTVPTARAAAVRVLRRWRLNSDAVDTAELIVSELTANATKASTADDIVALRLTASDGSLLIEVWDNTPTPPVLRNQSPDGEDGRGLFLVDALSSRWSWHRAKSGGKVVWAAIPADMMQPWADGSTVRLGQRTAEPVPDPVRPVAFEDDPALLRRVADGLRALDDWHLPDAEAAPPRTRPPVAAVGHPARMTAGRV